MGREPAAAAREKREVKLPLVEIFKPGLLGNTLTACWWMASGFLVYYSIWSLFPTYLQRDLHLDPKMVGLPVLIATSVGVCRDGVLGLDGRRDRPPLVDDHSRLGRRLRSRRST